MNATSPSSASPAPTDTATYHSVEEGLVFVLDVLKELAASYPATLALVVCSTIVFTFMITGLPAILAIFCYYRRRQQSTNRPRNDYSAADFAMDTHVALDESSSSEDDHHTAAPAPSRAPTIPRLNVLEQFPRAPDDDDEHGETPRSVRTVIGQWTPRKGRRD